MVCIWTLGSVGYLVGQRKVYLVIMLKGIRNALTSNMRPINPIPSLVINGRNKIFYYFLAIDLCVTKGINDFLCMCDMLLCE